MGQNWHLVSDKTSLLFLIALHSRLGTNHESTKGTKWKQLYQTHPGGKSTAYTECIYSRMLAIKDTNLRDLKADDVISSLWAVQYSLKIWMWWGIVQISDSDLLIYMAIFRVRDLCPKVASLCIQAKLHGLHMCLNWFSGLSIQIMQMICVEFRLPWLLEFPRCVLDGIFSRPPTLNISTCF